MRFPSYLVGGSLLLNRSFKPLNFSTMSEFNTSRPSAESLLRAVFTANNPRNVFSISVTGGGVQALSWIFSVPGASNSVVEGSVPYARQSLKKILKSINEPDASGSCSADTAKLMAKAAYHTALEHVMLDSASMGSVNAFGVACNAALVSDIPKKGPHRCHIAVYSRKGCIVYSIELDKTKLRSRVEEDTVCSDLVMDAISRQCNIPLSTQSLLSESTDSASSSGRESVEIVHHNNVDLVDEVRSRRSSHASIFPSSLSGLPDAIAAVFSDRVAVFDCPIPVGSVVFSGSFNPLHEGHIQLAKAYLSTLRKANAPAPLVIFELAVVNADKPALSRDEVERRVLQFFPSERSEAPQLPRFAVCVTSEPLFVGKSNIFKGCTFVVGADTCSRLIDSKYYFEKDAIISADSAQEATKRLLSMSAALTVIRQNGCKFAVGGRIKRGPEGETVFETLSDIMKVSGASLPLSIVRMFEELDESQFRVDLSSTELREKRAREL